MKFPSIQEIREKTKQIVLGQDELVDKVTVTIYRHLFKTLGVHYSQIESFPNNLLIIGNTGTGKTFTCREVAKQFDIPFIEINSKSISQEGWAGRSLIQIIDSELCKYSTHLLRMFPIIYLDEFDKFCSPEGASNTENISVHLQSSVLKYIEGMPINIYDPDDPEKGKDKGVLFSANTANFTWIFSGAFVGLDENKSSIGFTQELEKQQDKDMLSIPDKLIKFGMIPELVGRISRVAVTNNITTDIFRDILCNPKASFNQWFRFFRAMGVNREQEPNYSAILNAAEKLNLGVRGLISLLEPEIDKLVEKADINEFWNHPSKFINK